MNKILIAIAVFAVCIVVAFASAVLVVYNPLTPTQDSASTKVFDVNLIYAFTGLTNDTGEGHDHFGWGIETYPSSYYPVTAVLNLTYLGNTQNQPYDIVCEGYYVNYTADTGASVSSIGWLGTNFNASIQDPSMFSMIETPWGRMSSMYFKFHMNVSDTYPFRVTDGGKFSSVNGTEGLWSKGVPNTITVTVQRIGWLTSEGNQTSSVVNPDADQIIQQFQLQRVGDDFSYGTYPTGRVL
jgi:hypothetical protein